MQHNNAYVKEIDYNQLHEHSLYIYKNLAVQIDDVRFDFDQSARFRCRADQKKTAELRW